MSDNIPADEQQAHKTPENNSNEVTPSEKDIAPEESSVKAEIDKVETTSVDQEAETPEKEESETKTEPTSSDATVEEDSGDVSSDEDEEEVHSSDDLEMEDDETEDEEEIDYSDLSEAKLLSTFRELVRTKSIPSIKDSVHALRTEFNKRFEEDLKDQKEAFLAEGGNIIDFHYTTATQKDFNSILFDYREKRNSYYKSLKRDLQANLKKREDIIEELKGLLNVEESIHSTYQHFKKLQEQWHTAGPIPRDSYNLTWNTYQHHVENFYDFLHLNREFRDLDFKHNLEQKLKLIARAEELAQQNYSHKTFRELQMLHKMWKEDVGPVAKEYRDDIWDKFSDATKDIHQKRLDYLKDEDKILEDNYLQKLAIVENIKNISNNTKPNHNAWQQAIKKIQEQRDSFFALGRVPRAKNKEIWNAFKDATRDFNRAKNTFYKDQKKEQYDNLEKKRELIQIANDNKDSDDFETTTALMKRIQSDWKKIGHVPRKQSDKIWKQFKEACNHYFDRMFADKDKASSEEVENYTKKQELLQTIKDYKFTDDKEAGRQQLSNFMDTWHKIGRVPHNKLYIDKKFNKVLEGIFKELDISKADAELLKYNNKLKALASQRNDSKLRNEHFFLSKKIDETKDEIRQLENNLGFFQNVDESNPLYKEVVGRINLHKEKLMIWKMKLKQIKEIRDY